MTAPSREEITQRVYRLLRDEILGTDASFTPESDLIAAGVDSLALTQLLLSIEESTGVWVDESLLTPEHCASAESLAALVYEQLRSG